MFSQDNTCPDLLESSSNSFRVRGYHSLRLPFPKHSASQFEDFRAGPRSLAATKGISVDFFSSGYLDVSVPRVRPDNLCIQLPVTDLRQLGFPIRKSSDQSLFVSSPKLIADYYVLHRLLLPRHPPCALNRLTI